MGLGEPEVDVAVTKFPAKFMIAAFIIISLVAIACGVELKDTTPGAAGRCDPTTAQIDDFNDNVFTPDLVGGTCVGCHQQGTASVNPFKFVNPASLTTTALKKSNYCYHFRFGRTLIEFPLSPTHPQTVNAGEIPNLINWVNANYPP